MSQKRKGIERIVRLAMFSAIICLTSVITIPLPFTAVPISLGLFGILLASLSLPLTDSLLSVGGFLLLGFVGLPVFSSFQGGLGILLSPTGGYIIGYLPTSLVVSSLVFLIRKKELNDKLDFFLYFLAACVGILTCYAFGMFQFVLLTKTTFAAALVQTILPFIVPDLIKAFMAVILSSKLKRIKIFH